MTDSTTDASTPQRELHIDVNGTPAKSHHLSANDRTSSASSIDPLVVSSPESRKMPEPSPTSTTVSTTGSENNNGDSKNQKEESEKPADKNKSCCAKVWKGIRDAADWAWAFFMKHFLPMGLIIALIIGGTFPPPGKFLAPTPLGDILVGIIFFLSGLDLKTTEVKEAVRAWPAFTFACISILFITPLISLIIVQLPISPKEFPMGLGLFCAMPTTISSGTIMVGIARGNVALSLLMTVFTNIIGVFTIPFMMPFVTQMGSDGGNVHLDAGQLVLNLVLTIICPLVVGKALRSFALVIKFVQRFQKQCKLLSSICLILVPWMKISTSVDKLKTISPGNVILIILVAAIAHCIYLVFHFIMARYVLRLNMRNQISVVYICSQKTLPTSVIVLNFLPNAVGEKGIMVIPVICGHFCQIVIDSFLLGKFHITEAEEKAIIAEEKARRESTAVPSTEVAIQMASPTEDNTDDSSDKAGNESPADLEVEMGSPIVDAQPTTTQQ